MLIHAVDDLHLHFSDGRWRSTMVSIGLTLLPSNARHDLHLRVAGQIAAALLVSGVRRNRPSSPRITRAHRLSPASGGQSRWCLVGRWGSAPKWCRR